MLMTLRRWSAGSGARCTWSRLASSLIVTAASGSAVDRDQLIARITGARKIDAHQVQTAISELAADGLVRDKPRVGLSKAGQARYREIRTALEDITARLFAGFPPEDLATAGRVLSIVTTRANANSLTLSPELK